MFLFMIKVVFKKSEISGYSWVDNSNLNLDCYVEVNANTLKEAVEIVAEKYSERDLYWIKPGESYMKLEKIN